MKIRYTEELLKGIIRQQILPDAPKEVAAFSLDHLVICYLKKANGEKLLLSCVLDIKEDGILAIFMDSFRADKARGYLYATFSEMQGIKIKEKVFFYDITLQFTDGTNYVFQVMKRNNKHLPNQSHNIQSIISVLNNQHLNDMHNNKYKKKVIKDKITASLYIVTLIPFEIIAWVLSLKYAPNSDYLMIVIFVLATIIHFILWIVITLYVNKRKDRHF